jgi:DNA-binding CsgD family transcriptional regulator
MDVEQHSQCQQVIDQLTPRELEVLQAFAKGLTHQQVSKKLSIALKTVAHHKTRILDICRGILPSEPDTRQGYHFLYRTFASYFDSAEYTSTD